MANQGGTFTIDDREWQRYVSRFSPVEIDRIMLKASRAGAAAAAKVIKAQAPIGTSDRPSQFYRANSGKHGSFRASVKARKIRQRGTNARTIGHIVAPMGAFGFTRAWVEAGTKAHGYRTRGGQHPGSPGRHWFRSAADAGTAVADTATTRILETYARDR